MPFGSSQWMYNSGTDFYNGQATQSLRINEGDNMTRAFGTSPTSSTTMSFGGWCKFTGQHYMNIFSATLGGSGVPQSYIQINDDLKILLQSWTGSANIFHYITTRVIRDTSAWMHLWVQIDTTDGTASDRVKLYVNGVRETVFDTAVNPSSGVTVVGFNQNYTHYFGHTNALYGIGAYLADWWFLDGQDVSPVDTVGEFKNGVFIPKEYDSPTFGNKGFHLEFKQTGTGTASSSTIGADTSGNNNHWTSSGIVASDCNMPDSPENNFCTLNSLQISNNDSNFFPSEGNLQLSANSNSGYRNCSSTFSPMGFKGYLEFTGTATMNFYLGPIEDTTHPTNQDYADGNHNFLYFISDGQVQKNQGGTAAQVVRSASDHALGTISTGDVLGIAFDFTGTNRNVWFHRANTYGTASGGAGNPATGANPIGTSSILDSAKPYRFNFGINNGARLHFNFGQDSSFAGNKTAQGNTDENGNGDFYYAPPSGFLALCSANLPELTISPNADTQADDYFNTVLKSMSTNNEEAITGVGFQPDWVWGKSRNNAYNHQLYDSNRGVTKYLESNNNAQETTNANSLKSFDTDGMTVGSGGTFAPYSNGNNVVFWCWKANGGTTSSNTDGSITSTVQANTTAGFSIVTATSPSSGTWSVGHGLSKKPDMIIQKYLASNSRWTVWHNILTSGQYLGLNETNAIASSGTPFNFNITDSVIGGNIDYDAANTAAVYYVFHNVEGYSRFGSLIGNGSTDGTFVYTGFRPAWIMVKCTTATNGWFIYDTVRDTFNVVENILDPTVSSAESGVITPIRNLDILSNGFKARGSDGANLSGQTHIYMAFAEQPFKYANAR